MISFVPVIYASGFKKDAVLPLKSTPGISDDNFQSTRRKRDSQSGGQYMFRVDTDSRSGR